jgi:hypothetical protein
MEWLACVYDVFLLDDPMLLELDLKRVWETLPNFVVNYPQACE